MIEIKVNDEVRDVKAQLFLGLSAGEIGWCALGLLSSGAFGYLLWTMTHMPLTIISFVAMFIAAPFAMAAFLTWHELSLVTAVRLFFVRMFKEPKVKRYEDKNAEYEKVMEYTALLQKANKRSRKKKGKEVMADVDKNS